MKPNWNHWVQLAENAPKLDYSEACKPKSAIRRDQAKKKLRAKASELGLLFKAVQKQSLWAFVDNDGVLAGQKARLVDHMDALDRDVFFINKKYLRVKQDG